MQRLFSAFANSLPGVGLLALRLCEALILIYHGAPFSGLAFSADGFTRLFAAGAGALLLAGLFTPIASAIAAAAALFLSMPLEERVLLATVGGSLALLGPGAWSIDARLYGRRRIDLDGM
jgi:putative oxidoreductase